MVEALAATVLWRDRNLAGGPLENRVPLHHGLTATLYNLEGDEVPLTLSGDRAVVSLGREPTILVEK